MPKPQFEVAGVEPSLPSCAGTAHLHTCTPAYRERGPHQLWDCGLRTPARHPAHA